MDKIAYVTNCNSRHTFEIHGAGCGHLNTLRRNSPFADISEHEVDGVRGAAEFIISEAATYQSQDQGWSVRDFRVLPCAREGVTAGRFAQMVESAAVRLTNDDTGLAFEEVMGC